MSAVENAILDCLDRERAAVNMTGLVALLTEFDPDDIKIAVGTLHEARRLNRIGVIGPSKRYYVYFSLYVPTTFQLVETVVDEPVLTPEMAAHAISVLERELAPAPIIERRTADRRASRITIMDVVDRWKLPFRLSRVIEIVGGARNCKLTEADAEQVARLVREHVRGGDA